MQACVPHLFFNNLEGFRISLFKEVMKRTQAISYSRYSKRGHASVMHTTISSKTQSIARTYKGRTIAMPKVSICY